ncbi:hypothetical protein G6R40_05460 [Chryseobacterium sp. POL2]|uniref:hypothetical protein n=1 Tax=Chryseobacterium sp. POL2 TaxID=2713414 RepID=UPI0013E114F4|nr:hypothetical protein [Chryseobacterium sp. POL2]QIG89154.1 hypothetical protein G6R40_05460 [Chryseobacterium sp. POL2]
MFTACSSSDDDSPQPEQVAKEITAEELSDYVIIEEYLPKASAPAEYGDKPILMTAYLLKIVGSNQFLIFNMDSHGTYQREIQTTYDASTGITAVKMFFGYYDFTRDASGQIVVIKSRHNEDSPQFISKYFDSQYIQLEKRTLSIYDNASYKNITGNGYYRFRVNDNKWRWKENTVPTDVELTWSYNKYDSNNMWLGGDSGSEKYKNLFVIIPKGNGWKGQHKDKDLLLINTMDQFIYKAVGDIGVYEVNN